MTIKETLEELIRETSVKGNLSTFQKICYEKIKKALNRLEELENENFELRQKLNTEEENCVMLEKRIKELEENEKNKIRVEKGKKIWE